MLSCDQLSRQRGATMVELMVGITVGLLVLVGVMSLFVPSLRNYQQTQAIADIQESQRFTSSFMSRSISGAGYVGCDSSIESRGAITNAIEIPTGVDGNSSFALDYQSPIVIFDAATNLSAILGSHQDDRAKDADGITQIGDVIYTLGSTEDSLVLSDHNTVAETIALRGDFSNELADGAIIALNDCNHTAILEIVDPVVSVVDGVSITTVSYSTADTDDLNNTTDAFNCSLQQPPATGMVLLGGSDANCDSASAKARFDSHQFPPGTTASILQSNLFYLASPALVSPGDNRTSPSLFTVSMAGTGQLNDPVELISGVDNFRAIYGIRGSGNNEIHYRTAAAFSGDQDVDGDGTNETWLNVGAVKLHYLFRSQGSSGEKGDSVFDEYTFPNSAGDMITCTETTVDPTGCVSFIAATTSEKSRLRRVMAHVVNVRNELSLP